jgi:hypothetical protein
MIYAESSKYEFAKELCDFVEKTVNDESTFWKLWYNFIRVNIKKKTWHKSIIRI